MSHLRNRVQGSPSAPFRPPSPTDPLTFWISRLFRAVPLSFANRLFRRRTGIRSSTMIINDRTRTLQSRTGRAFFHPPGETSRSDRAPGDDRHRRRRLFRRKHRNSTILSMSHRAGQLLAYPVLQSHFSRGTSTNLAFSSFFCCSALKAFGTGNTIKDGNNSR